MNKFFKKKDNFDSYFPSRSYGKIDHFEFNDEGTHVLIALDLIEGNWLDAADLCSIQDYPSFFTLRNAVPPGISPLEHAQLYRLEVDLNIDEISRIGIPLTRISATNGDSAHLFGSMWLEIETSSSKSDGQNALLYDSLYAKPVPAYVRGKMVSAAKAKSLNSTFNLSSFPVISPSHFINTLRRASTEYLAIYDVGQGNCNALLDKNHFPTLYFDLGAGVFRNAKTTPPKLQFCFTENPTIILSHWDADHWAGAFASANAVTTTCEALHRKWIAPRQDITVLHYAFALELIQHGKLFIIDRHLPIPAASSGTAIEYWFGTSTADDRNGSGIVLNVVQNSTGNSWLLTGDCDYVCFPPGTHVTPLAIVAPHHGAKIHDATHIPAPSPNSGGYHRLVYSFGPDNKHGKYGVSHPRREAVLDHASKGWNHAAQHLKEPGHHGTITGMHARSTSCHPPANVRQSVVVGWSLPSGQIYPLCTQQSATQCSGALKHS